MQRTAKGMHGAAWQAMMARQLTVQNQRGCTRAHPYENSMSNAANGAKIESIGIKNPLEEQTEKLVTRLLVIEFLLHSRKEQTPAAAVPIFFDDGLFLHCFPSSFFPTSRRTAAAKIL